MQVLIFILALFFSIHCYGWNLDLALLKEKCVAPTPEWMEKVIAEELKPFVSKGISKMMITKTLEAVTKAQGGEISYLVRIKISEGEISWESPLALKEEQQRRLGSFLQALQLLQQIEAVPDLEMLISLADQYDRPLFLRFTEAPVLTVSKDRSNHCSVLIPNGLWHSDREMTFAKVHAAAQRAEWHNRLPKAFWRGSLSEGFYHYFDWDFNPRPQLVFFSRHFPTLADAGFVENHYFIAMHYTWQKWMKENECVRAFTAPEEQTAYRFLIAIDGSAAPASLQWQLFTRSTLLKAESSQVEWFYADLQPYVHYMPFRTDSADLGDKILWLQNNPDEASSMAKQAEEFAQERLPDEAIFLYTYKLLKAYSILLK